MKRILIRSLMVSLTLLLTLTLNAQKNFGGLALYTVRDDMAIDARKTLTAVADAGYAYVEAAEYKEGKFFGLSPQEFKAILNDVGLKPISTHQGDLTYENVDQMIAAVKEVGFKYFVLPVPPMDRYTEHDDGTRTMSDEDVKFTTDLINKVAKKCNAAGLELLYHNHEFEFQKTEKGIVPIEYFLENTDPKMVNFEMDLYWVTKAGADPVAYFEKYPGRFKLWHVKDMDTEGKFSPVGEGTIDFGRILKEKKTSGMKYYFVEQDDSWDKAPLEVIKISHEGTKKIGFK